ncbi:hypothetical protein [Candidatus Albibeggiatoa sp. nov. BB20]|uniref:hypothetical protein n=1 Tax=Candidatus Albibeggiatoa sp. nov. BB20 TaxID=3162723 RepID=UPI003365AF69
MIGYDNTHAIKPKSKKYAAKRTVWDHKHLQKTVEAYEFESAGQLLEDFWESVNQFIEEK